MNIEQFHQQPDDVRQHVLEAHRYWNTEHVDWSDFQRDQFIEQMESFGVAAKCVQWSGFCSQGDGACFDGHTTSMVQLCAAVPELNKFSDIFQLGEISMSWASSGHYSHEHSLRFDLQDHRYVQDSDDPLTLMQAKLLQLENSRIEELEVCVTLWIKEQCSKLYSELEEEYDHLTSDEAVLESLEINNQLEEAVLEAREALDYEF